MIWGRVLLFGRNSAYFEQFLPQVGEKKGIFREVASAAMRRGGFFGKSGVFWNKGKNLCSAHKS